MLLIIKDLGDDPNNSHNDLDNPHDDQKGETIGNFIIRVLGTEASAPI